MKKAFPTALSTKAALRLRQCGLPWTSVFSRAAEALMAGKLVIVRDGVVSIRK